jgi:peptide/nickel transport system ATP-binding protein
MDTPDQRAAHKATDQPILEIRDLTKLYPIEKGFFRRKVADVRAVDGVTFSVREGETLSLVGESGCGKTTTARCIIRAIEPTSGQLLFRQADGSMVDLAQMNQTELRPLRRDFQMVFQDPFSSLNPRMTIFEIISEPLLVNHIGSASEQQDRVADLLRRVGLRPEYMQRFPHAFSGGQRQRIGIARALAVNPRFIIADEPVSALDVSIQAQVLNLMMDLQDELGLTYLMVSHDLSVVNQISDRIAVMYLGKIVEIAPPQELFRRPKHPYTAALIESLPKRDPLQQTDRTLVRGEVANPANPPVGCKFHPRCPFAIDRCIAEEPALEDLGDGRQVRCHRAHELELVGIEAD